MKLNTIIKGDCVEVMKGFEDDSIDTVFTSPPYNRIRNDTYKNYDDNLTDYEELLNNFTKEAIRISRDKVIVNIQQTYYNKKDFFNYLGKWGGNIKGIVIWIKTNPRPGSNYDEETNTRSITNAYEYFIVMGKDGDEFRSYGKEEVKNYVLSTTNMDNSYSEEHGAVMNYDIAKWFIYNFTKKGDIVLDCFMGTGTTAIACEELERKWLGIELNDRYINISYERLSKGIQTSLDI